MSTPGSALSFRRSLPLLERYVLRESLLPFLLGFGLVTFLFILQFLFEFLDLLLAKDTNPLSSITLKDQALSWSTLHEYIKEVKCRQKVFFLDCCRNEPNSSRGTEDNILAAQTRDLILTALSHNRKHTK